MQMEPGGALLVQPVVLQPHSVPLSLQQPPPHPQHQHTSWNSAPLFQKRGARRTNTQPAGETRNRFRHPPAEDELVWTFKDEFGKELRCHQPVFVAGRIQILQTLPARRWARPSPRKPHQQARVSCGHSTALILLFASNCRLRFRPLFFKRGHCAYVVEKMVSFTVQDGAAPYVKAEYSRCSWGQKCPTLL